jgi:hypothetical protein
MIEALPISPEGIARAAEELVAEHGSRALAKAREHAQTLRSEGYESLAVTWDLICTVVRDLSDSNQGMGAHKMSLGQVDFLSE